MIRCAAEVNEVQTDRLIDLHHVLLAAEMNQTALIKSAVLMGRSRDVRRCQINFLEAVVIGARHVSPSDGRFGSFLQDLFLYWNVC